LADRRRRLHRRRPRLRRPHPPHPVQPPHPLAHPHLIPHSPPHRVGTAYACTAHSAACVRAHKHERPSLAHAHGLPRGPPHAPLLKPPTGRGTEPRIPRRSPEHRGTHGPPHSPSLTPHITHLTSHISNLRSLISDLLSPPPVPAPPESRAHRRSPCAISSRS